jgi:Carboxypeptidase regulatory-like domain
MRFRWLILTAILILAIIVAGFALAPDASARYYPGAQTVPSIIPATPTNDTAPLGIFPLQPSYLSLSLTTDKAVYLSGEVINITVSTTSIDTHISLMARLPDGSLQPIENFALNYSHTVSWTAPAVSGQIRIICDGEARVEVWNYCTRYVCTGPSDNICHWANFPCLQTVPVTGNTYNDIRVFSRAAPVSGRVIDSNQRPVAGATVAILSTGQSTMTDNNGNYQLTYQLGNNYGLVNQVPTMTDTLTVDAIACEPQPPKSIQIQAESGASNVNFALNRVFYPPDLDLPEFTYAAFSIWPPARDFFTWQNIAGITVEGQVQVTKIQYGSTELSPQFFTIGDKGLYLITTPQPGRYLIDIQGPPNSQYAAAAAATVNSAYIEPVTVNSTLGPTGSQRLRFTLQSDQIQLQVLKTFPILALIIPVIVAVLGGLVAAFFLTGGKTRWGKAFSRLKLSPITEIATINKRAPTKAVTRSPPKRVIRNRAKVK